MKYIFIARRVKNKIECMFTYLEIIGKLLVMTLHGILICLETLFIHSFNNISVNLEEIFFIHQILFTFVVGIYIYMFLLTFELINEKIIWMIIYT